MPRRAAMWPTELTDAEGFTSLTAFTQRLFQYLWLHPDLNAAGFIAYQPAVWANAAPDLTVDSINVSVDEVVQQRRGVEALPDGRRQQGQLEQGTKSG